MQPNVSTPLNVHTYILAYIVDAHNVGCVIRPLGETSALRATYSATIQENGVVIRLCHLVVVDRRSDPLEVVWRIGTAGEIEGIGDGDITLNLGYRTVVIPLVDSRPEAERIAHPISVGDTVVLRGSPIEHAAVVDTFVGDEVAHPERLHAVMVHAIQRLNA